MSNPANSTVQNLLPVQAYFSVDGEFQTFIGQGQPFTATIGPDQSGLHITDSTIDSSPIGATTPSTGAFTSGQVAATPVGSTDIANKLYVDSVAAGISWKAPFQVATTANLASRSGLPVIDTYQTVAGDRILVKDQSTSSQNGIYIASAGTWAYSADGDTWSEYISAIGFVEYGTQAGSAWYCAAQAGGTLGTTAQVWSNFSVATTYTAGTGLTLSASQFSITNTGVTAATYGSASAVPVVAVNAQGQITSATTTTIAIANTQVSGLGTMSTQAASSVAITGGTIDGTAVGATTAAAVTGTTITAGTQFTGPGTGLTGTASGLSIGGTAAKATNIAGGVAGSIPYQTGVDTTTLLAPTTDGYILTLASGLPVWAASTGGVTSFSGGTTGLTPATSTTGAITLGGTLVVANGGTGATNAGDARTNLSAAASGANGDITSMTGVTGGIVTPDYVTFDITPETVPTTQGSIYWDTADNAQTLSLVMEGGNAIQQIGQETYFRIKCSSAVTEGQVVMFTGTVGASGGLTGAPATGLTAATASYIMGIATESGALNDWIYVTSFGTVRGINTTGGAEAWVDGQILYYDPAVTGGLTKTLPSAPNAKIQVCAVEHAASNGSLFVRPTFGGELGQYEGDVQVTSPANGDLLIRNQTSGKWVNAPLTAGTNVTITNSAGGVTIAASGGLTVTDDTTTNATRYLTYTSATSGTITGINTASTELTWNPGTGVFDVSGSTGGFNMPIGTTAERPSTTTAGNGLRYNTTTGAPEIYTSSGWQKISLVPYNYTVSYLAVGGGGGGGGGGVSGGGGAGGFVESTASFTLGTVYTATIGAGGGGGSNTTITSPALTITTALGGGQGGGNSGGSGGGGSDGQGGGTGTQPGSSSGGFGNNGGAYHGGGGGAGAAGGQGTNSPGSTAGNGGTGKTSSITGTSIYYGGGGGGIGDGGSLGSGGAGGGGSAAYGSGTANSGGGGGGPYGGGGSGVVILSVPTTNYSGTTTGSPTVTTSGSNTIIQFNSSGTYTA